jgi:putative FmdB family regulatory protein
MPIYVYRCERCGREVEEIQKYDDPPPRDDTPCTASQADPSPCDLRRAPTTFTQRWLGEYSSDGRGGWTRQGDFVTKVTPGK